MFFSFKKYQPDPWEGYESLRLYVFASIISEQKGQNYAIQCLDFSVFKFKIMRTFVTTFKVQKHGINNILENQQV